MKLLQPFNKNTKYILQRSIGLLILLIIISKIDLGEFVKIIGLANLSNLFIAVLLFLPSLYLRSLRLFIIMSTQGSKLKLTDHLKIYSYSIFIGSITPGRIGEFVKAIYFEKKGTPFSASLYGTVLDRLFDVVVISIIGSTVFFSFSEIASHINTNVIIIYMILLSIISILLFNSSIVHSVINKLARKMTMSYNLSSIITDTTFSISQLDVKALASSFIITTAALVCNFSSIYYLAQSIDLGIPYIDILGISALVSLVSMIPVSFLGLGTRDIVLIQMLSLYGIDKISSVAFSSLIFLLLISNALICSISLLTDIGNLNWKERSINQY